MRSLLQLLCSCLLCSVLACGSATPRSRLEPQRVSSLVERWELGAEINDFIDPQRGLLVLRYCAGEDVPGCESSTYLHCGESLRQAMAVLGEDLEMRQNYVHRPNIYECVGHECSHPPLMRYDYKGTLRFDTSTEPPVLIEVLHVEGTDASPRRVTSWAEQQRASHRTQRCTEGKG